MEVHHPHHLTHKKKWNEYLLEFLMLFLAVFLGFLAENLREEKVEHHREEQFIHSLVEDLKSDTLQSSQVLSGITDRISNLDSLLIELSNPSITENSNNAYRMWNRVSGFPDFISNDRTIQQLKSSGSLRLIRNKAVSDSIMKYDRLLRDHSSQNNMMNSALIDQHIYCEFFDFLKLDKKDGSIVPLTEKGKNMLNEAYANRKIWKNTMKALHKRLNAVNVEGKSLLSFIQKEYHIEE